MKSMLWINVPRGTGEYRGGDRRPEDWRAHLDCRGRPNR
jgi:hypothetical protein